MARGLMTLETFSRVIGDIRAHKEFVKVVVLYHGGEPFLNKNLFTFIERVKGVNPSIFVKTVSNGMALTSRLIEQLLRSNLDAIEFSLDGLSLLESEFVRVKSRTELILSNINRLIEMRRVQRLSKPEIAIASTQFVRTRHAPEAEPPTPLWLLSEFGDSVTYKNAYAFKWPHMGDIPHFETLEVAGEDKSECDHVISTITVRANGDVVPCCYDLTSQLVMGNVNDHSLFDIWNGERYRRLRESIVSRTFNPVCGNCSTVKPPVYLVPRWNKSISLKSLSVTREADGSFAAE